MGLGAGLLTTVAGIGGGLVLIAALSGFTDLEPAEVVVLTAPVLLVANAMRAWIYRARVDRPLVTHYLVGAVPAAIAAAWLLPRLPARGLQIAIAIVLLGFVAERLLRPDRPPAIRITLWGFVLVGAFSGATSATVGGSGPISAPFLAGRGLTKQSFVGTGAVCDGSVHAVKAAAYIAAGLLVPPLLPVVAVATAGVIVGNVAGGRILSRLSETAFVRVLLAALVVAAIRLLVPRRLRGCRGSPQS